jgi:prepilin-type N-terminal cleavage/methylation domain-containing protein
VRGRTGFTLVEVIVVLVILAILAAIAIPALTGYIDKARLMDAKAQLNALHKAFQTMVIEEVAKNGGGVQTYNNGSGDFLKVTCVNPTDPPDVRIYSFVISPTGKETYKKLTGYDFPSVYDYYTNQHGEVIQSRISFKDFYSSGEELIAYWIGNVNSEYGVLHPTTDPWENYFRDTMSPGPCGYKIIRDGNKIVSFERVF